MRRCGWLAMALAAFVSSKSAHGQVNPACPPDFNVDCVVNGLDLASLLGAWTGAAAYVPCPPFRIQDLNQDCRVNGLDLAVLLGAWGPCICSAQLAGNTLTGYPFFEYVRAFNQGAALRVAIDPTRFPNIVGKTCRVYVVEHKTPAQWTANPTLTDVTGDGFQVETFVAGAAGGQIQANTKLVSVAAGSLPGTAHETGLPVAVVAGVGSGLGHPYDVIFDCNQNGSLGAGDYIDGYSTVEAGMYVVHNMVANGPFAVTAVDYAVAAGSVPAGFERENTFYPNGIGAAMVPLVVISHGNGHDYRWYDHIGNHLASYGYIVMSHENNTVPGPLTASFTTFKHTNAIIAQQAALAGGALNGHIDANRIVWIGHSRGAEGVAAAYFQVANGLFAPVGWNLASVRLVSSIAPTDFLGATASNPGEANYHLWTGVADNDVNGCADCNLCQTFHLHERAEAFRQSISIYGAGHGDFHNNGLPGDMDTATGPCLITRGKTHAILKGYSLPLVKRYVNNNIPAKDFLWRQWERFKPIGAPAEAACAAAGAGGVDVNVNLMYKDGPTANNFVIDDYQGAPALTTSSSGGAVAHNFPAGALAEGWMDDKNLTFTTGQAGDGFNGMTVGSEQDFTFGAAMEWGAARFYEFAVLPAASDFRNYAYLSFRACQETRHANTTAALGDLTFHVLLRDNAGVTSRMSIGAYGGGVEEPYQRTGCGVGTGWANDFETIRLRLADFANNGSGINLGNIVAVRFEFAAGAVAGVPAGAGTGRIGLDDVELTTD